MKDKLKSAYVSFSLVEELDQAFEHGARQRAIRRGVQIDDPVIHAEEGQQESAKGRPWVFP